MKKEYIYPNITVVNINIELPIAASDSVPVGGSGSASDAEGRYTDSDLWNED